MLLPPPGKIVKSGPFTMHFQHSGAKIREFEQNTDIIKFWLFYSVTAQEHSIFYSFLLANSYEPLVISLSVLNHVSLKIWVISKEKQAVSSCEIASEFRQLSALIENPAWKEKYYSVSIIANCLPGEY